MKNYTLFNLLCFAFIALSSNFLPVIIGQSNEDSNPASQPKKKLSAKSQQEKHIKLFTLEEGENIFDSFNVTPKNPNSAFNINDKTSKSGFKVRKDSTRVISGTLTSIYKNTQGTPFHLPLQIEVTKSNQEISYTIKLPHNDGKNALTMDIKSGFGIKIHKVKIPIKKLLEIKPKISTISSTRFPLYSIRIDDTLYEPTLWNIWHWGFDKKTKLKDIKDKSEKNNSNKKKKNKKSKQNKKKSSIRKLNTIIDNSDSPSPTLLEGYAISSKLSGQKIDIATMSNYLYYQTSVETAKESLSNVITFQTNITQHKDYGILVGLQTGNIIYQSTSKNSLYNKGDTPRFAVFFDIPYILKHFHSFRKSHDSMDAVNSKNSFWLDIHDTRYQLPDELFEKYMNKLDFKKPESKKIHYVLYQDYQDKSLIASSTNKKSQPPKKELQGKNSRIAKPIKQESISEKSEPINKTNSNIATKPNKPYSRATSNRYQPQLGEIATNTLPTIEENSELTDASPGIMNSGNETIASNNNTMNDRTTTIDNGTTNIPSNTTMINTTSRVNKGNDSTVNDDTNNSNDSMNTTVNNGNIKNDTSIDPDSTPNKLNDSDLNKLNATTLDDDHDSSIDHLNDTTLDDDYDSNIDSPNNINLDGDYDNTVNNLHDTKENLANDSNVDDGDGSILNDSNSNTSQPGTPQASVQPDSPLYDNDNTFSDLESINTQQTLSELDEYSKQQENIPKDQLRKKVEKISKAVFEPSEKEKLLNSEAKQINSSSSIPQAMTGGTSAMGGESEKLDESSLEYQHQEATTTANNLLISEPTPDPLPALQLKTPEKKVSIEAVNQTNKGTGIGTTSTIATVGILGAGIIATLGYYTTKKTNKEKNSSFNDEA